MENRIEKKEYGKLYVVATPMGNYLDMSPRGKSTLESVSMIAAEDTRRTIILLNKLGIHNKLVSNHSYNEFGRVRYFIDRLKDGESIAIVTDAGTPCISDPGNALIGGAIKEGIQVVGIPGCCAAINALVVSGFDLSSFQFCGFFPRGNGDRLKEVKKMRMNTQTRTFVFYESPKRIMSAVEFFLENNVDCNIALSNDMTKRHEMVFRGSPAEVREQLLDKGNYDKGEFVIVLEIPKEYQIREREHILTPEAMLVDVIVRNKCTIREAIQILLDDDSITYSKNELYAASLVLKELW